MFLFQHARPMLTEYEAEPVRAKFARAWGADVAAEADWLFNQPTDVAFGKNGEVYVSDGYGNSRVVKFGRNGNFLLRTSLRELTGRSRGDSRSPALT